MKTKKTKRINIPALSLNAKVEQMAKFLRKEVKAYSKLKERNLKIFSPSIKTPEVGSVNLIQQIAKRLRSELHPKCNRKRNAA